jgi:arylsulfatase A-like enzyme
MRKNSIIMLLSIVVILCSTVHAGVVNGASLMESATFTTNPGDPALPTSGFNLIKFNASKPGVQWSTTASSNGADDETVPLVSPNLFNDSEVTSDPGYDPATTKLTSITPNFVSGNFALASTSKMDPLTQIDAFYTIAITTTGGTFTATSDTATVLNGSLAGQNTTAINAIVAAFNNLTWDVDPFSGGGLVYDSISGIGVTLTMNTVVPNAGAIGTSFFTFLGMPIEYTAETFVSAPVYDFSIGIDLANGSATDLVQMPSQSNAVFGASSVSTFEINKSGTVRTADKVKTDGSILCDGTLNVVLQSGSDALAAGDAFDLLDGNINGAITGEFATVNLPALSAGLEWTTNTLYTQGFIWVRETNTVAVAKPNVIILFADDLGYADAGFQSFSSSDIITPNIDTIAENGVVFTAGYANGPVCSPSRGGLMTGQYQNRFALHDTPAKWHQEALDGNGDPIPGVPMQDGIPTNMTCFAHRMQDQGYATCMIGKWHGGETREHYPPYRGFDEFFGFNNGATSYYPGENDNANLNRRIMRGMFPVEREDEYLTDAFGREAVSFINRHADEPFFLYVPFNAPHGPMTASDEHSQILFSKNASQLTTREKLISMVYSMDLAVGEILDAVSTNGLLEETLIIFYSDNGGTGPGGGNESYNTPLNGKKGDLWEGGIRVPFCMQWKGQVPVGLSYDFVVSGLDLLPTAVNLAGGSFSTNDMIDGNDLMPAVTGQTGTPPNDIVLWWHNDRWVARDNEWKLVDHDKNAGTPPNLYYIIEDISETTDVYAQNPTVVSRLQSYYNSTVAEFDLVTDASKWSSSSTYYMDITDPAYAVIYEPTNVAEWLQATYPSTFGEDENDDFDNDGISNYIELVLGLPVDIPSVLTNGLSWDTDSIGTQSNLYVTFQRRVATLGENAIPVPNYVLEETNALTNTWGAATAVLVDGPNPTGDPDYQQETYRIDVSPSESKGFYRLQVQ